MKWTVPVGGVPPPFGSATTAVAVRAVPSRVWCGSTITKIAAGTACAWSAGAWTPARTAADRLGSARWASSRWSCWLDRPAGAGEGAAEAGVAARPHTIEARERAATAEAAVRRVTRHPKGWGEWVGRNVCRKTENVADGFRVVTLRDNVTAVMPLS